MTPPHYYSTTRARSLGSRYKQNLERIVESIVRSPVTSGLQFANNIAANGGIGFFTHSATRVPDERFLEVVLGVPDTFDASEQHRLKTQRVFAKYGPELLTILASDAEIAKDPEVAGYGVNLSWRSIARESAGPRVILERAVIYLSKDTVQHFLRREITEAQLLERSATFVARGDGILQLVSGRAEAPAGDRRAAIAEETISENSLPQAAAVGENRPSPEQARLSKGSPPVAVETTTETHRAVAEKPRVPEPAPVKKPPLGTARAGGASAEVTPDVERSPGRERTESASDLRAEQSDRRKASPDHGQVTQKSLEPRPRPGEARESESSKPNHEAVISRPAGRVSAAEKTAVPDTPAPV
ncbi:MAG TPA: hypothetical protein VNO43_00615, partial [Candidatus Eisenbacteria bacterium]|nr:hypothetical protein [Candidatus Eisenbacteria bacterium]